MLIGGGVNESRIGGGNASILGDGVNEPLGFGMPLGGKIELLGAPISIMGGSSFSPSDFAFGFTGLVELGEIAGGNFSTDGVFVSLNDFGGSVGTTLGIGSGFGMTWNDSGSEE